jgi:hypothetical protein
MYSVQSFAAITHKIPMGQYVLVDKLMIGAKKVSANIGRSKASVSSNSSDFDGSERRSRRRGFVKRARI